MLPTTEQSPVQWGDAGMCQGAGSGPPQSGSVTNLSTALVPAPLARGAAVASQ